jgi:Domain of Unknown Function (DUF1206)
VRDLGSVLDAATRVPAGAEARRETESVEASAPFRWLVRAGFVARAITYGVIGALALALALGDGTMGAEPSQEGALALIASAGVGRAALVVVCAGLLAYALWKLTQAVLGYGPEGGGGTSWKDRIANFAGGITYLGFFAVALRVLLGSSENSASQTRHAAAGVLGWPGGVLIVGVAGLGLLAVSLYQLYEAFRGRFAHDSKTNRMSGDGRRVFMVLGRVGLSARALVFALVGYFLIRTAIEFKANDAVGLEGALTQLHQQPLGPWWLGLVAAGLITFAVFSLFEARYRRL